uniref:Uncharacterized protein n=1 Tax=Phocoena sinus TaxID=42100 RepID=A0A8C9CQK9_PHOSS
MVSKDTEGIVLLYWSFIVRSSKDLSACALEQKILLQTVTLKTLDEESSCTRVQPPAVQFKGKGPEPHASEEGDSGVRTENLTLEVKQEPYEEILWCREGSDGHHETVCQHATYRGDSEPSGSLELQDGDATGEKTYECDECRKTFTWIRGLQLHRRIHIGKKPYSSTEYGKAFIRRVELTQHQGLQSKGRPYQCKECGKGFSQKAGL